MKQTEGCKSSFRFIGIGDNEIEKLNVLQVEVIDNDFLLVEHIPSVEEVSFKFDTGRFFISELLETIEKSQRLNGASQ
jgi:hypothetical protein